MPAAILKMEGVWNEYNRARRREGARENNTPSGSVEDVFQPDMLPVYIGPNDSVSDISTLTFPSSKSTFSNLLKRNI